MSRSSGSVSFAFVLVHLLLVSNVVLLGGKYTGCLVSAASVTAARDTSAAAAGGSVLVGYAHNWYVFATLSSL